MTYSSSSIRISFTRLMLYGVFVVLTTLLSTNNSAGNGASLQKTDEPSSPKVIVVDGGESRLKPEDCIATLVGPGINQPDPFPGYGGFVGWISPSCLRNGDWLVGFSAGYWHASAPTPLRYSSENLATYLKLGLPADIVSPTGGRAMMIRSTDKGKTWSKPVTILDTPDDDRHPALPDGSLFITEQDKGGHTTHDAQNMSIRCLILRIRTDHSGIDLLPAPNRIDS